MKIVLQCLRELGKAALACVLVGGSVALIVHRAAGIEQPVPPAASLNKASVCADHKPTPDFCY